MAYKLNELSRYLSRPDEFYQFHIIGGATYRYTPMRLPVFYQGFEFTPKAIRRGDFTFKKDFSGEDSMDIQVQADLDILSNFKIIVPRRTMMITIFRRHRGDDDLDVVSIFTGRVRGCSWEGAKATLSCDSMQAMVKRGGLNLWYQVDCNHFVYDAGCGLQKADWRVTGPLQSLAGNRVTCSAFATLPDGTLKHGFIEAGNGNWFIIDHVGDTVTLLNAMEGIPVGSTISAYHGCPRTLDYCWDHFGNGLNHLGFKWSPADNVFVDGL